MASASDPAVLAAELASNLRSGVTLRTLGACPTILGLAVVKAKAASGDAADLAVAARIVIREASRGVDDGDAYGAAGCLLGVAPGTRDELLKGRRQKAADALHLSVEHLRKEREEGLLEAVADELYAADSAYRLRQRHREQAEQEPQGNRLGIDWLEQHRTYRRIWTPVTGMRNDLKVLREDLQGPKSDTIAISGRLVSITWHWARFETGIDRFVEEQGGLWLLADVESEVAAAEAIYKLTYLVPFGRADGSWLRTLLAQTPYEELDGFGDKLVEAGERRRELMGRWIAWASCPNNDDPACRCCFHAWQRAADSFTRLIDEDWYRVADYYRYS